MRLGEALVSCSIITAEDLKRALGVQNNGDNRPIGDIIAQICNIPVGIIEGIFAREILSSLVKSVVEKFIQTDKFIQNLNVPEDYIDDISVNIINIERQQSINFSNIDGKLIVTTDSATGLVVKGRVIVEMTTKYKPISTEVPFSHSSLGEGLQLPMNELEGRLRMPFIKNFREYMALVKENQS